MAMAVAGEGGGGGGGRRRAPARPYRRLPCRNGAVGAGRRRRSGGRRRWRKKSSVPTPERGIDRPLFDAFRLQLMVMGIWD
jgi:hypothetical protein